MMIAAITAGAIAAVVSAAEREAGAPLLQELRSLTGHRDNCFKNTCRDVYEYCLDTTTELFCTGSRASNACELKWRNWCKNLEKECDDYDPSGCVTERRLTGTAVYRNCCKDYCVYIHEACMDLTTNGSFDHCFNIHCECIKVCNECLDPQGPCCPNCGSCRPCGSCPNCPRYPRPCRNCNTRSSGHTCEPCPLCPNRTNSPDPDSRDFPDSLDSPDFPDLDSPEFPDLDSPEFPEFLDDEDTSDENGDTPTQN